jgi:mitochondrial fission protein ELM1
MVSEAVSSGKKVIVFKPEKRVIGTCKHDIFVEKLQAAGHIFLVDTKDIGSFIYRVIKENLSTQPMHQDDAILQAARETI